MIFWIIFYVLSLTVVVYLWLALQTFNIFKWDNWQHQGLTNIT